MNGMFSLNGLGGFLIAVVLLLAVVFALGYKAVSTQKAQSLNPYVIENANSLQMKDKNNATNYKEIK